MKKISKVGTSNSDDKYNDKKFVLKSDEDNKSCSCWVCEAQKYRLRVVQRDNFRLSVIFGFGT